CWQPSSLTRTLMLIVSVVVSSRIVPSMRRSHGPPSLPMKERRYVLITPVPRRSAVTGVPSSRKWRLPSASWVMSTKETSASLPWTSVSTKRHVPVALYDAPGPIEDEVTDEADDGTVGNEF